MKKSRFLIIALILIPLLSSAAERSENQMQQAAMRVLNSNGTHGNRAPRQSSSLKLKMKKPKLSVYGYDDGGFAVVSSDDRFNDVIGYSETEYCDSNMPCGFKWWIETANEVMEQMESQEPAYSGIKKSKASVEPFLTTKWGQGYPYNALLFFIIRGNIYEFVTGCVATAMAQVMKYYEYPEKGTGSVSYIVWNYLAKMEYTFGDYYDWSNMLDEYNYQVWGNTNAETKAVATLMRDCGVAVKMNYGTTLMGSGASSSAIVPALKEHFSYSDKTALYKRSDYNKSEWMLMIFEELSNNRPIIYMGIDKSDEDNPSGHAFVLHGYDSSGAVYVNWGWNGNFDGYYDIDLLNPDTYQYSEDQGMVLAEPIPETPLPTDNKMNVRGVEVAPGESVSLCIELDNEATNLMGWQCDILLPEGLSLELKPNGKPAATLGDRFATTGHTISSSRLANGAYRFVATSMDGESIPGSIGMLFTVTLKANNELNTGTSLIGDVTNIEFNTQDNQKMTFDDVAFSIKIANDAPSSGDNVVKVQGVNIAPGESMALDIELENKTTNLMGWQCDIMLPEGLSLVLKANGKPAATLGSRFSTTEHTISSSRLANGAYRFIATSIDGEAIPETTGTLFTVTLLADASVTPGVKLTGMVKNIEFNTQDNQKLTFNDVTFTVVIPRAEEKKCATPTITFADGKLMFNCETEDVEYAYEITSADVKKGNASKVKIDGKLKVSVYAMKEGYEDSEVAIKDIELSAGAVGDVNGDGVIDVSDYIGVANIILTGNIHGE